MRSNPLRRPLYVFTLAGITDLMHDAGIESVHDGQDENSLSKASSANTEGATPSKTGTNHDAKNAVL